MKLRLSFIAGRLPAFPGVLLLCVMIHQLPYMPELTVHLVADGLRSLGQSHFTTMLTRHVYAINEQVSDLLGMTGF